MKIHLENGYYDKKHYHDIAESLISNMSLDRDSVSLEDNIIKVTYLYARVELDCDFPENAAVYYSKELLAKIGAENNARRVISHVSDLSNVNQEISELLDEFEYIVSTHDWDEEDEEDDFYD